MWDYLFFDDCLNNLNFKFVKSCPVCICLKYKENDRAGLNRSQSLLLYGQRFEDKHRLPLQGLHY